MLYNAADSLENIKIRSPVSLFLVMEGYGT